MLDIRIAQEPPAVKTAPQRLIWRKPVIHDLVECTLVRDDEGGGYVRVQVPGEAYVRSIHVTDIGSWIVETPVTPPAVNASESQKNTPSCDSPPERSQHPFTIKPVDPALASSRYQALADERRATWERETIILSGPVPTWIHCEGCRDGMLAIYKRRYERAQRHVDRLAATPPEAPRTPRFGGLGDVLIAMALQSLVNVGDDASDLYRYFTPAFVEASGKYLTRHQEVVGETRANVHVAVIYGLPYFNWKAV